MARWCSNKVASRLRQQCRRGRVSLGRGKREAKLSARAIESFKDKEIPATANKQRVSSRRR
jgi:hypothetical protein